MKKFVLLVCLFLVGCASTSAIPLGNDLMQIDVSAPPAVGRTGAQKAALETAAKETLAAGYDKFIVMDNQSWSELEASGSSYGNFHANRFNAFGASGSNFAVTNNSQISMIIKMFRDGDKGADKAIDARSIMAKKS